MKKITMLAAAAFAGMAGAPALADTLDDVKAKGFVQCGVSQGLPGFSSQDDAGEWLGLDVDVCRAVAAAIFGDPAAVKFTPLSSKERFTALSGGEIDMLSRNTTWTMRRDSQLGIVFTGVSYYDGQGFLVPADLGVASALELDGARVCIETGTTTELNVTDYFRANNMTFEPIVFENASDVVAAYDAGNCDVYTTDRSGVAGQRLKLTDPEAHVVLPEIISKEPLGPVVAEGDTRWFSIVKWVLFALVNAEEMGVTSENVEEMKGSDDPAIKRLLGVEGNFGEEIGLAPDWAAKAIAAVGNYEEIYERNVGPNTPLKLERGLNALWNEGGIMYAPPIR